MTHLLIPAVAVLALSGCATVERFAPKTVAGYKANGIVGAIDGAAGAIVARCEAPGGGTVTITLDVLDLVAGDGLSLVEKARDLRAKACAKAGAIRDVTDRQPVEGLG